MLVNVTTKRFWGGRLIGPDTPHERIEYDGDPDNMPSGFVVVTQQMAEQEDSATEALRKAKIRASEQGVSLQEALNPSGPLDVSGGVDPTVAAVKANKVPLSKPAEGKGVKVEDIKNKVIESAEAPEKKAARKTKEQKTAEKNDKVES